LSSLRGALWGLFAAAVALSAVMVALVVTSDHEDAKAAAAILGPFIGLSFAGTGVFAWLRRPHNRFGALMTGVGFAWFVAGLTEANDPFLFTVGAYLGPLYLVLVAHMLLAFPDGRLESTAQRVLVTVGYLTVLLVGLPFFLLGGRIDDPANAPDNAFAIVDQPDSAQVFMTLSQLIAGALIAWLVVLLVRKRQDASPPQRRAMAPVLALPEGDVGGMRLPLLRETRMPAVVAEIGPADLVVIHNEQLARAVVHALAAWVQEPIPAPSTTIPHRQVPSATRCATPCAKSG